jgi:hypothetical protein
MSATALRRAITSAAIGFVAAQSPAALAITGGVSVDEVLAVRGGSRYTEQQVAFAHAVSAVTVALINVAGAQANGQGTTLCSATIVHPRVVLTAAHCVLNGREVSRRIIVLFEGGASQRQALDVVVHPAYLKVIRSRTYKPQTHSVQPSRHAIDPAVIAADFALVLLHRPIPEGHDVVAPVPRGFRDHRTATKLIAGYGTIDGYQSIERLSLHFAELQGNSKLDQGALTGEGEIIMESRYRQGARVNVCDGDSGGPILVLDRGASRWRQLAVTSAADQHCREVALFAPIDSQRAVLREMFDALMQGELGAEQNPSETD